MVPGGHIYLERIFGELLCLNDCKTGRMRFRGLCAGPMDMVNMPSSFSQLPQWSLYGSLVSF